VLERPSWAPRYIDLDKPSFARVYDYLLGGACNTAHDRALAKKMIEALPNTQQVARSNRAFLRRAVQHLVRQGVRQFLDIGSGIPNVGNVHEIAQKLDPECRVVYVDNDPIAIAHGELLLKDNQRACALLSDFRFPEAVLQARKTAELIDFTQPVALLLFLVLHHIPDSDAPARILARYREALAPGSYLALSHPTLERATQGMHSATDLLDTDVDEMRLRSRAEITELISGFEPIEPGIVFVPQWRPDSPDDVSDRIEESAVYGVVTRKI
jgi:SAM-dependent methyltransferase